MRVLQVLPELNMGGVERVTLDMVAALRQQYPATWVASQNGSLLPELERLGGTHLRLPLASKNPLQILANAFRLARLVRTHHIQLIHARSRAPAWSALWAAQWTKTPLVTTFHGSYSSANSLKTFYNSVMVRGDRVIAISEFILRRIQGQYPSSLPRVRLIREGIDIEEFNPQHVTPQDVLDLRKTWGISPETTLFLLPSRITRIKGQTTFIEAIRQLNNPNIVGVILGRDQENSSYPAEVRRQIDGLPIRIIPPVDKPKVAYAAADFIVFPSLNEEAFGRITAEAGAMERPIIATDHGATSELCHQGRTGFLVPPDDSQALAAAMAHALTLSPEERQAMGKAGRAHIAEKYSAQRMCAETIQLYQEMLP